MSAYSHLSSFSSVQSYFLSIQIHLLSFICFPSPWYLLFPYFFSLIFIFSFLLPLAPHSYTPSLFFYCHSSMPFLSNSFLYPNLSLLPSFASFLMLSLSLPFILVSKCPSPLPFTSFFQCSFSLLSSIPLFLMLSIHLPFPLSTFSSVTSIRSLNPLWSLPFLYTITSFYPYFSFFHSKFLSIPLLPYYHHYYHFILFPLSNSSSFLTLSSAFHSKIFSIHLFFLSYFFPSHFKFFSIFLSLYPPPFVPCSSLSLMSCFYNFYLFAFSFLLITTLHFPSSPYLHYPSPTTFHHHHTTITTNLWSIDRIAELVGHVLEAGGWDMTPRG